MNRKIGITKTKLNLHAGPGELYEVLGELENSSMFVVLKEMGSWLNVQAAGTTGYVQEEYVTLPGWDEDGRARRQARPIPANNAGVVSVFLHMHSGPGLDYEVIRSLDEGVVVDVLEDLEDWLNIHYEGDIGYVIEKLISWEGSEPETSPADQESPPESQQESEAADREQPPVPRESQAPVETRTKGGSPLAGDPSLPIAGLHTYGRLDNPGKLLTGPGREYPSLLKIPAEQPFRVLEDVGAWLNVLACGEIGYIPQAEVSLEIKAFGRLVLAEGLRRGPGLEYKAVLPLLAGETVEILEDLGEWLEISVEGKRGFIPEYAIEVPPAEMIDPEDEAESPSAVKEYSFYQPVAPAGPSLAPKEALPVDPRAPLAARLITDTWNRYGGLVQEICAGLGLDLGVALAVLAVEAGGRCFGSDGRMIIRFENHVLWHYWGKHNQAAFEQHFQFDPAFPWRGHRIQADAQTGWQEVHANDQSAEWQAYELAAALDRMSARLSTSMGAPQIMGFHYEDLGFANVHEMWSAFAGGEKQQIAGFFDFLKTGEHLDSLRRKDFVGFARLYNGDELAGKYGGRILEGVEHYERLAIL
jgi:uncharacterized protein YgiM (DUF1202 family)